MMCLLWRDLGDVGDVGERADWPVCSGGVDVAICIVVEVLFV